MEEELEYDFSFPTIEPRVVNYVAVFNQETGAVISIGPEDSFPNIDNKIFVDKEFVDDVVNCRINIHNCFVDFYDLKLEIKEIKSLFKIDDMLHRIPESRFVDFQDSDIYVTYNESTHNLKFELTERFYGTRPAEKNSKKQKMVWSGDTNMDFFVTEYNDPHKLIQAVQITLNELTEKSYELNLQLPNKFSIFTRRLFKKYIMEVS
jgi:hypothetical protein